MKVSETEIEEVNLNSFNAFLSPYPDPQNSSELYNSWLIPFRRNTYF